ncbi:MAG TPA: SBBP repeat-containing protein [Bacteroidia bacterium]|nr:SBBP repeat-containing protein [Bacteroidia bacterium]
MKLKLYLSILATLIFSSTKAQNSLVWATYFGGSQYDVANSVATDAAGNVYLTGYTSSTSGIASAGFQNTYGGGSYDAFLTKFDPSGNLIWSTYYGNNNNDHAYCVTVDDSGNVYIAGGTSSISGIASGGFQNTYGGGSYDAFVVKFDSSGSRVWSSYYGGTGWEEAYGIATDHDGNVYISGFTNSALFGIGSMGWQNTFGGGTYDAFLVKFNASGLRIWGTYYGGPGDEGYDGNNIATDNNGNIYLSGWTSSTIGIASGGFQDTLGGTTDAFLVKFNSAGILQWGTYYGGTGDEGGISNILFGKNVATDFSGNVYLAGTTESTTNISSNGFQNTYGGGTNDCYLVKFDSTGSRLWATYYGDTGDERGWSVATDMAGNAYITGRTNSISGIASAGFQNAYAANFDAFIVSFSASGVRLCASYFGGTGGEWAYCPSIDAFGNIYMPGFTYSTNGIASAGFQNTFAGGTYDGFLAKLTSCSPTMVSEISDEQITLYPNPFSSESVLKTTGEFKDAVLIIENCFGQTVAQMNNINGKYIEISRKNLNSGIYFIKITEDNHVKQMKKFVIID